MAGRSTNDPKEPSSEREIVIDFTQNDEAFLLPDLLAILWAGASPRPLIQGNG